MLLAACGAGVGVCFSAPVGGVLFALEVTGNYFAPQDLWTCFWASLSAAVVYRVLDALTQGQVTRAPPAC